MSKNIVTLEFPDEKTVDLFWGVFLDGGVDDTLKDGMSMHGCRLTHKWDSDTKTITFSPRKE